MKKLLLFSGLLFSLLAFGHKPEFTGKGKLFGRYGKVDYLYPVWGFYSDFSFGKSGFNNNQTVVKWDVDKGFGYTVSIGYFRSFSPFFRVKAGIGIDSYSQSSKLDEYNASLEGVDSDSNNVIYHYEISGLSEFTRITYFTIPVIAEFGNANIDKIGYFLDAGLKFSFPLSYHYTKTGESTKTGYYPDYSVVLFDVPEYGYLTGEKINVKVDNSKNLNNFNVIATAKAGFTIPLSGTIIIKVGLTANYGIINCNKGDSGYNINDIEEVLLSDRNSLFIGKDTKVYTNYIGFEVGVFFNQLLK